MGLLQDFVKQITGMAKTAQKPGNSFGDFLNQLNQSNPVSAPGIGTGDIQQTPLAGPYNALQQVRQNVNSTAANVAQKNGMTPEQYNRMNEMGAMVAGAVGGDTAMGEGLRPASQVVADRGKIDINVPHEAPPSRPSIPFQEPAPAAQVPPAPQVPAPAPAPATPAQPAPGLPPIKQNPLTKLGNAITSDVGKVSAPDASSNLYGATHTNSIQDALIRNGVDHYSQLPQAANNLYQSKIYPELAANPKMVPLDNVTNGIVTEMRKLSPGLDQTEAKAAAHSVINDLYDVSRNSHDPAQVVPSQIDTPSLFNVRQGLNDTVGVKNYFNGTPPRNASELASVAGRNAISDIIAAAHPSIAEATKDYGMLKDAVPSLFKASQQGRGIGLNVPLGPNGTTIGLPSFLGGPVRDIAGGALRTAGKVAETPIGKIGSVAGLVGAGTAVGMSGLPQMLKDTLQPNSNNSANNNMGSQPNINVKPGVQQSASIVTPTNSQSTDLSNIKPDPNGDYQIPDTSTQTVVPGYISYEQKTQQINDLTKQLGDPANSIIPGRAAQINQQIQNVQKQYDDSQAAAKDYIASKQLKPEIKSVLQDAPTANMVMNSLRHDLQSTPPGFLNNFKSLDQLKQYNNGQYAQLAAELAGLQAYANDLAPGTDSGKTMPGVGQSEQEALARLDVLQKKMLATVNNNKDIYGLVATPVGGAPQNSFYGSTQPQPPANPAPAPQGLPAPTSGGLAPIIKDMQFTPGERQVMGGGATP